MNRTEKSEVIDRLRDALVNVPAVLVADFNGLTVGEVTELRSELRQAGVHYEVVKNSLVRQALKGTTKENMAPLFKGNSAIAYHDDDPTAPAKLLVKFAKDHAKFVLRGAWLDGKLIDANGVDMLSKLPGRDELRGKLLSVLNGVPTKFVRTLIAGPQQFVRVLQARAQQLEA